MYGNLTTNARKCRAFVHSHYKLIQADELHRGSAPGHNGRTAAMLLDSHEQKRANASCAHLPSGSCGGELDP
jgi:hypothetical protein